MDDLRETVAVVFNPTAGEGRPREFSEWLRKMFRDRGIRARVLAPDRAGDVAGSVREAVAAGICTVVAAGGDGTVSAVASALHGSAVPLGILPLGTLNHFARDVGIPLNVERALDAIVAGRTVNVDVAVVNGRPFLNNSSLGFYPRIVRLREQHKAHGLRKWLVYALAVLQELPHYHVVVELDIEGRRITRRTPALMVGNNEYRMNGLEAASRASLASGQLALYILKPMGRFGLAKFLWRVFRGRADEGTEMEAIVAPSARLSMRRPWLDVACDGEVVRMRGPLEYRVMPGALRVLSPSSPGHYPSPGPN